MAEGSSPELTGGCLCGAVRYRMRGISHVTTCHCHMCQRVSGGPFIVWIDAEDLEWTRGKPTPYQSSEEWVRGFCAQCGSTLTMGRDGGVGIAQGTLDDPRRAPEPSVAIWIESRLPWVACADADRAQFPQDNE